MSIPRQNNKPYLEPEELIECNKCCEKVARKDYLNHVVKCAYCGYCDEFTDHESKDCVLPIVN